MEMHKLIELEKYAGVEVPMGDWDITAVFGDVLMCEYVDLDTEAGDGDYVVRDGIAMPLNTVRHSWRIVKVLQRGLKVSPEIQAGDLLMVPSDKGIPCIQRTADGKKLQLVFINEERVFCKVKPKKK